MTNEQLCLLARQGDRDAANLLIESILPSIRYMAGEIKNRFPGIVPDKDDLVQEALIRSLKAMEEYDPDRGNKFLTFVKAVAKNAMLDYVSKCRSPIPPDLKIVNLDDTVPGYDKADGAIYEEIISDIYAKTPEQVIIEKETITEVRDALQRVSERERAYIHYRYGFEDGRLHTRDETASHFHLTKSRAKGIERSALGNVWRELFWW